MAGDPQNQMIVACTCGAKLRVPVSAVGKKTKCPKCGTIVAISAPAPRPVAPAATDGGLLDDLAKFEQSSTASAPQVQVSAGTAGACPNCSLPLPPHAKLCIACGFDLVKGRALKQAGAASQKSAAVVGAVAKAAGGFMLGTGLSVVGALIGAGVWCAVCVATKYEIGYIAWLLGLLAGVGMHLGWRQADSRAGVVAAGVAICGIAAAKVMLFAWFLGAPHPVAAAQVNQNRDPRIMRLAGHRSSRAAQHSGLAPAEYEAQEKLFEAEVAKCQGLSEEQIAAAIGELEAWEAEGKWSDEEYIRDALIHEYTLRAAAKELGREVIEDEEELEGFPPEKWKACYAEATAKVAPMKAKDRLAELRRIEHDQERLGKEWQLAIHRARLLANKQGLSYVNPKRNELTKEQYAEVHKLPDPELEDALANLKSWEQSGKWGDNDYVRSELIYREISEVLESEFTDGRPRSLYTLSEQEWQPLYTKTAAKVARMTPGDPPRRLKAPELPPEVRAKQKHDYVGIDSGPNAAMRYVSGDILGAILKSMLRPMQLLFIGLAVVSAYRVASSGFSFGRED